MSTVVANGDAGDISPSPSRRLFPKTLRSSKVPPSAKSSSSRAPSVNEDASSGSPSVFRSSTDSVAGKPTSRSTENIPSNPPSESKGLKSLLAKAKVKRRKKQAGPDEDDEPATDEVPRGRSVGDRAGPNQGAKTTSRSLSRGSRGTRKSEASRITYGSSEDSLVSAPPMISHPSHAGYLTHSSPLIQKASSQNPSSADVPVEGPGRTNSLPTQELAAASAENIPTPAQRNKHAATLQTPPSTVRLDSTASAPTLTPSSSDRKPSVAVPSAASLKGLFGKKADDASSGGKGETLRTRRTSKVSDSGSPSPQPKPIQTNVTVRPTTPSNGPTTPLTTVTPPTPTGHAPTSGLPAADGSTVSNPNIVVSASGQMISHRRARSNSSGNAPSKLSTAISAPLTPTIEEVKSAGTTPGSSDRPVSQSGFFSTVFSAAQSAATTLGNTITNNPLATSARDRNSTSSNEKDPADHEVAETVTSAFGAADLAHAPPVVAEAKEAQRPLAIDTLGSGELNFGHLGISTEASPLGPSPTMATPPAAPPSTSVESFPTSSNRTDVERSNMMSQKDNGSIHTVGSGGYPADETTKVTTPSGRPVPMANPSIRASSSTVSKSLAEEPISAISSRATYEPSINGDRTPPTTRDWDRESGFRRSGSVRSRTDLSMRRQRGGSGATGTTIAAAIGSSHAALAAPAAAPANGSVPRLTGFAVASKKRNRDFHHTFRSVPEDDYLIEDYSAALQKDILLHGRFYVSEGHLCFNSNIFGYVTTLIISFDEVVSIEKKNTAMFIPNGLIIQTLHAKNVFASFTSRDSTYDLLIGIWKISHPNLRSSLNGVELDEAGGGDKTVKQDGADSEEESEEEYGEDEEVYDEDEEEEGGFGSFTEAGEGSVAGSEMAESAVKPVPRKASSGPNGPNGTTAATAGAGEAKGTATDAGSGALGQDFPGPATHGPTECGDQDSHYDKIIKDEVVAAPLGKVYSLIFGPGSGAFMSRWLSEDQKVTELQFEDDKRGISDEKKSRSYSYIKPLSGSIGPKQTKCMITESIDAFDLDRAVSVTVTTLTPDVPSGNAFSTKTKYCLMWAEGNATRLLMNCTIEWTAKSWLKGPIEKGANDGQEKYANDIMAAIRATISSKARGVATSAPGKGGKMRRRKKSSSEATAESTGRARGGENVKGPISISKKEGWGLFEPIRGPVEPIVDILKPMITSNVVIGFLVLLLLTNYLRSSPAPPSALPHASSPHSSGLRTPERLAAYEEIWRHEESELWEWLDERIAMAGAESSAPATAHSVLDKLKLSRLTGRGKAEPRGKKLDMKDYADKLGIESKMSKRQIDEAIRVTQERLDALREVVEKGKVKAGAGAGAGAGAEAEAEAKGKGSA
ncbi:MAG: hypothetical protein M1838_004292 [Thelocarpon superellum]|nr:MAG: hypothetical protein M1838_004292 [Thelocarpon superellum]